MGNGQVKVAVILPLSAGGNAAVAAQSMKNASEMALSEFLNPNLQLLIKDDAGSPQGAQQAAQQAVDEGAEIILGPLFATSVPAVAQVARGRGISVIAFSTNSSVAGHGVYLLSFLPESDVNRIVEYAATIGKRSLRRCCPRTPTATLSRLPSSRRCRNAAAVSSCSKNTVPTVPQWRVTWRGRWDPSIRCFWRTMATRWSRKQRTRWRPPAPI